MQDLLRNDWINGTNSEVLSTTPLATPDVLSLTGGTVKSQITATLNAFHKAHRAGFRLRDVSSSPLVLRRKRKREEGGSSGSTDSSRASTPVPPATNVPSPLVLNTTASPTLGVTSAGPPGTAGFQLSSSLVENQPLSCAAESVPQFSLNVTPQANPALWDLLRRDHVSRGFSPCDPHFVELDHPSAAESSSSRRSTPDRSPARLSSSSRGSTPQRSPVSRTASFTSLGFSPAAASATNSSESRSSEPAAAPHIPSSSVAHSDNLCGAASLCSDNSVSRKRKLADSLSHEFNTNNDDDDDCVIIGFSHGFTSSSDDGRKTRKQP